eukprot:6186221-Pleurochrysis_carterae.AAC.1
MPAPARIRACASPDACAPCARALALSLPARSHARAAPAVCAPHACAPATSAPARPNARAAPAARGRPAYARPAHAHPQRQCLGAYRRAIERVLRLDSYPFGYVQIRLSGYFGILAVRY